MFDPIYVTEVINDILGRRGLQLVLAPRENASLCAAGQEETKSAPQDVPGFPKPVSLKTARLNAGYTQSRVEKELGFSKGTLSRWEAGIHNPRPVRLRQLCRLYGVNEKDIQMSL